MKCGSVQELEMHRAMDQMRKRVHTEPELEAVLDQIAREILQRLKDGSKQAVPTSE